MASGAHGIQELLQQGWGFFVLIAIAHPATLAAFNCRIWTVLLAVVGRVAQADQDGAPTFDFPRSVVLASEGFVERGVRKPRLPMGRFQRVSQVDQRVSILNTELAQPLREAQLSNSVRSNEDLEGVKARGKIAQGTGNSTRSALIVHRPSGVLEHRDGIGSRTAGGVQHLYTSVSERQWPAEARSQQLSGEPDLRVDNLDGREIHATVPAQFGVVCSEEVLVK